MRRTKETARDGKDEEEANKQNNQRHILIELNKKKKKIFFIPPYASTSRFTTHMQDSRSQTLYNHTWVT